VLLNIVDLCFSFIQIWICAPHYFVMWNSIGFKISSQESGIKMNVKVFKSNYEN